MNNQYNQNPAMNQNQAGGQQNAQWNDQQMVNDLLDTEKQIAGSYGNFIIEGSTQPFRSVLEQNMKDTLCDQFQVFEQMQQRGWYQTKPAQQPDIQTAKQTYSQKKGQLV